MSTAENLEEIKNLEGIENPGKPEGDLGIKTLTRMNTSHAPLRRMGFRHVRWKPGMRILDVGCGGGETIAEMLQLSADSRIDGLDHSRTAVEQTSLRNQDYLGTRVEVTEGDVGSLPYPEKCYDLVTAVETIYFWPDMERAFGEIHRVLKPGGMFLILCDACDPNIGWPDPFHQIRIYRPGELVDIYRRAGFEAIGYEKSEKGMLVIHGQRREE